jgi:lysophospholipase L1-like esterase
MQSPHTLLCLGDSYTIGESVPLSENFPSQVIQLLKKSGYQFEDPELVAQTGWTTDELQDAVKKYHFRSAYDFVTILIGVNNQYRGRTVEDYKGEFEVLLKQAIQFAGGKAGHVIVLSIPDWGVTPFAKNLGRDGQEISKEIDSYNAVNKEIAEQYKVGYVDITPATREASNDLHLIAPDGLHPSSKEYAKWAEMVWTLIKTELN